MNTTHDFPQQLTLLPSAEVPAQFRLDENTRRRGTHHISEIRQLLAQRAADRDNVRQLPTRRPTRPIRHTAA